MQKIHALFLTGVLAVGCARANEETDKKLDSVLARLDMLEKKIDARPAMGGPGAAVAGAQPQRPQPRPGPDPNTVYAVPVDDRDPEAGAKFAKVTIVEGYDYACPYCKQMSDVVDKIVATRGGDVKYVGKQFVVHPQIATNAALAACAAERQGHFADMSTAIWTTAWSPDGKLDRDKLASDALEKLAAAHGLDATKFHADMTGSDCQQEIQQHQKELAAVGVNGTPAVFINGKPYQGPRTIEGFNAVIDDEIKKADAAIKSGVRLEDYYASIVKAGKKSI
jgi:protein-disulfide isomerase